jgi:hypothetical protein
MVVQQNKILTKEQSTEKGWQKNDHCIFYRNQEAVDHLFIHYSIISCL